MERLLLLGQDAPVLGQIVQRSLGPVSVCLSAGADPQSPSFAYKGHKDFPNEDGAVVLKDGPRWLLAVADGHMGHEVSHQLLESLHASCAQVPARLGQLSLWLSSQDWLQNQFGGSTLLVACLEEATGGVFGLSFGDCTLATVSARGSELRNKLNETYLRAGGPIPVEMGQAFQFTLAADELLLLFSDGVSECCYRDPHRSIQQRHIENLAAEAGGDPIRWARALTELALAGVDGHPGGQDNVAVVAYARSNLPENR
jgi:hypothetical protein